jgi:hypothetical protein
MSYPYRYIPGPSRLGVGVSNLAFQSGQSFPTVNPYSSDHLVRASLNPLAGGINAQGQKVTAVSARGNGLNLSGAFLLSRLAKAIGG